MITKMDVLRAILTTGNRTDRNQTRAIADRVSLPANLPRVRTVLHQLWGAGMVDRGKELEWRLTDAGKDELADLI